MSVAIVTGSSGLVGSEAVERFVREGFHVVGMDNDMRAHFFGAEASTQSRGLQLAQKFEDFTPLQVDIRDFGAVESVFAIYGSQIELVVHTAAQPAHDWAARAPLVDFGVNAQGTLNVIEATRRHCPDAPFVHCSTSKVYGDNPNLLPLEEQETRYELPQDHPFFEGITPEMSIDLCTHSLFGASKAAADLVVQEYGRYFHMPTVCFRPGCLTGPTHQGAQLHGFLAYLMKCTMESKPYTVFGYKGKQVRCNLHAADLVDAFDKWRRRPGEGEVYNIGGGRDSNCSMLEAIEVAERIARTSLDWNYEETNRIGDHVWWISSNAAFQEAFPAWRVRHDTHAILQEMYELNLERWT